MANPIANLNVQDETRLYVSETGETLPSGFLQSPIFQEMRLAFLAAQKAGEGLLAFRQDAIDQYKKEGHVPDFTPADIASNQIIFQMLNATFPEDGYISQEGIPSDSVLTNSSGRYWVVDPLDGTTSFCKEKETGFCVIITLVDEKNIPVLNVTHFPAYPNLHEKTTYVAIKGYGAFKQIGESPFERLKKSDDSNLIIPFSSTETSIITEIYLNLRDKGQLVLTREQFLRSGSCGFRICALADESFKANFYLTGCLPTTCGSSDDKARVAFSRTWDIGGVVILEEVGGYAGLLDSRDSIDWSHPQGLIYPHDGHQNLLIVVRDVKTFEEVRKAYKDKEHP